MYARRGRVKRICSKCQPILIMLYIFMIWQPWKSRSQNTLSNSLCLRQFWSYQSADKMSYISSYAEEHLRSWLKQSGINCRLLWKWSNMYDIMCSLGITFTIVNNGNAASEKGWMEYVSESLMINTEGFCIYFFTEKECKNTSTYMVKQLHIEKVYRYLKNYRYFCCKILHYNPNSIHL